MRAVVAYNRAASAAEHDACDQIVASIGAYAPTLRRRTHRPDEFINLLHQWIENRSINVALRKTLDGDFTEQTCWQRFNPEERLRATEILTMSLDIVRVSGDSIRARITVHHEYKCYKCVDSGTQCDACEALLCNTCDVDATE